MTRTFTISSTAFLCLLVVGCPGTNPTPQTRTFSATLNGAQEIPPVTTAGTATATFTVDTATGMTDYEVMYSNLSGPVTGAHLHNAPVGEEAGVSQNLTADFLTDTDGLVEASTVLSAAQISELEAGNIYINLHTGQNPDGEIRGQLTEAP